MSALCFNADMLKSAYGTAAVATLDFRLQGCVDACL